LRILPRRREATQHHPARRSSFQRGVAVLAEINAGAIAQRDDDVLELLRAFPTLFGFRVVGARQVGMLQNRRETSGDLLRRHHQIDGATGDRTLRHADVLR
jgi:hypothetical protein